MKQHELASCPFCGGKASISTYETESLWSHAQVTYTKVGCDDCDVFFHSEPGYEVEAPAAWNARAALAMPARDGERCGDNGNLCPACSLPAHELTQEPGCSGPLASAGAQP